MVAKVSNLAVCPKCSNAISFEGDKRPERCPAPTCNYRFRKIGEDLATEFSWGKDPAEQFFEMTQQLMEKYKDKPINEIIPEISAEDAKDLTVSNQMILNHIKAGLSKDRDKFMLKTNPADVEGWFKSLHYLMTLSVSSGDKDLVAKLVIWGKEIGKIAEALETYVKAGGRIHEKADK